MPDEQTTQADPNDANDTERTDDAAFTGEAADRLKQAREQSDAEHAHAEDAPETVEGDEPPDPDPDPPA